MRHRAAYRERVEERRTKMAVLNTLGIDPALTGRRVAEQLLIAGLQAQARADAAEASLNRYMLFAELSQRLAASLESATVMHTLVEGVIPDLGDAAVLQLKAAGRRQPRSAVATSETLGPRSPEWWAWIHRALQPHASRAMRRGQSEVGMTSRKRRAPPTVEQPPHFPYMVVPLRARGHTLGSLSVVSLATARLYAREDLDLARIIAAQAGLALDNANRYEELQETLARQEAARGEIDPSQARVVRVAERRQVARELHDHVEQTLFSIGLLASSVVNDPAAQHAQLSQSQAARRIRDLAIAGAEQLRTAIFELNQPELDGRGLVPLLFKLARSFQLRTGIDTDLAVNETEVRVPSRQASAVRAVAHEALTNVERHAQASAVLMSLRVTPDLVTFTVHDNGVGPPPLAIQQIGESTTHFGLRGVTERVERLNGELIARPGPDGGFLVRAHLPLARRARS
jgi:signal transduction histidine kinase